MSRRARERQNARPWEQEQEQPVGDWSDGTGEGEEDGGEDDDE